MKKSIRGPLVYLIAIVCVILIISYLGIGGNAKDKKIEYSQFLEHVKEGNIKEIAIINDQVDLQIVGIYNDTEIEDKNFPSDYDFYAYISSEEVLRNDIQAITGQTDPEKYGFNIRYTATIRPGLLESILPYLIILGAAGIFMYFLLKQTQGGNNKAIAFGKSRARLADNEKSKKTFADVAGADEEKEELREIVDFLRSPDKFTKLGARIPKGVLLIGPPGSGKTLLAKAVAGEANVPFFSISGSDFVELFVGVGASRVRDLFETAKKSMPCIVFIDEIDAVGRHRGAGMGGGNDEREQTLNQLLVEMDGFNANDGIIIMAATNRVDTLDPALMRPGRFDRQIIVNYPDIKGREDILKVHSRGKPLNPEVDLGVIAKRTVGFTGADLENVLNEAAILTARRNKKDIGMSEIEEAITRVIAGLEKKSHVVTEEDKRITAIHEVGHAICAKVLPHGDPVHEISIIQRGMAAGYTMTLPEKEKSHVLKNKILDDIVMMLGGRAAESILLSDISTGAINDLQRATELAKNMVIKYGMSDSIGPVYLADNEEIFLGKEFGHIKGYSDKTASVVDSEVKRILEECFEKAKSILRENVTKLNKISIILMEKEKLYGEEFETLFSGETI
ncbi:MAG: ATP-dependent zinc metalloprotease FtsH [Eubacteriales bacterium]